MFKSVLIMTFYETHLITSQNLEGGDDLVCRVCVGCFPGHEINEGLEGHSPGAVGIYYAHDASKFGITLATTKKHQVNRNKQWTEFKTCRHER